MSLLRTSTTTTEAIDLNITSAGQFSASNPPEQGVIYTNNTVGTITTTFPSSQIWTAGLSLLFKGSAFAAIGASTTTRAMVRANTMTAAASGGTGTAITFTSEELDTTNSFNPATGTFVAPRTGQYAITAQFFVGTSNVGSGGRFGVILSTNGGSFGAGSPIITYFTSVTNPSSATFGGSYVKTLNAGDSLTFRAFLDTATSMSLSGNANFDYITITEINNFY